MDLFSFIGLSILLYYCVYILCSLILDCDIALAVKEKFGKPISSLKGKKVWILGASSGIGEELAYVLAEAGCKLVLSARRVGELERVKEKCLDVNSSLGNNDVEVYPLDILNFDLHKKAFEHVINIFGGLDILVNNAGRSQRAQWENIDLEVDKDMFNLNVFSILSLSRIALKYFLQIGKGHIVVTSSVAGIISVPVSASYCGAKHALHGYFNTLLMEQNYKNIDVTMVCPGPVQTNFLAECFTDTPGKKYGKETAIDHNKISARRCAVLMGIAIANKMNEVWISKTAILRIMYGYYCFPNIISWLMRHVMGTKHMMKLRDSETTVNISTSNSNIITEEDNKAK